MGPALGPVAPDGTTGVAPGLRGGTPLVVERVAKTVGERASYKWPRVPHPRLVETDAAIEFSSSCIA